MMKMVHLKALALLVGAAVPWCAQGQNQAFVAAPEEISLDDIGTQITNVKTIFNGETFGINVKVTFAETEEAFTSSKFVMTWSTYVDDAVVASGITFLDTLQKVYQNEGITNTTEGGDMSETEGGDLASLSTTFPAGEAQVFNSGTHTVRVVVELDGVTSETSADYQSYSSGASFVPLIVILFLAMTTHLVEFSLGFGVFVGACMVTGTVVDGFKTTLDTYILGAIADVDHAYVYLFTLYMAGFVGLLEKSGGVLGFTAMMSRFARSPRTGQMCSYFTGLVLFFDDYANILIAGPCMKPVQDSVMTSREKLAFVIDATAAPVASLTPVSSWVGFEVGLIQAELDRIAAFCNCVPTVGTSGFGVFLQTIKYRYYPIFMLMLIPSLILSQRDFGPMLVAERKTRVYGRTDGGPGKSLEEVSDENNKNLPSPDTPQRWFNLVVPIIFLVFFILFLLVRTGQSGEPGQDFLDIMQSADSYSALLWGTMAAALCTMGLMLIQFKHDGQPAWPRVGSFVPGFLYRFVKKCLGKSGDTKAYPKQLMTWQEGMAAFLVGMEHVFGALVVLTLAWSAGEIMTSVGLDRFFSMLIVQSDLDPRALPTISFVVSIFIAFATGSSWGCMTIMFPLLLVPTYVASNGDPIIFYATTAGVLSGSVAGDHASPISDTTVLSSMSGGCQLLQHVKTQAPYVVLVTAISIVVGTLPVGYEAYPNGVGILLGLVLVIISVILFARAVIHPNGNFDPFQELMLRFQPESELHKLKADTKTAFETAEPVPMEEEGEEGDAPMAKALDVDDAPVKSLDAGDEGSEEDVEKPAEEAVAEAGVEA